MAPYNQVISSKVMSTNSNDTALCIIPPNIDCRDIDRLRELYDKAYGKWPAHINLIYPFVAPDSLPRAQEQIKTHLAQNLNLDEPQTVALTETGLFKHRNNSTIFLQENASNPESSMATIRSMALQAIGQKHTASNLHLTIGQSEDNTLFSQHFLLSKAQLLPALNFRIGALAILIRERSSGPTSVDHMRLWGVIDLSRPGECWRPSSPEYWVRQLPMRSVISTFGHDNGDSKPAEILTISGDVQPGHAFKYNSQQHKWIACQESERNSRSTSNVTISSYNVLVDSEYPPERDRDTFLTTTMLSIAATADILVLQEVSDDFLSHILNNPELQTRYPFTSHAPPSQPEIGPLSSLRNIVILSSWSFSWKFVPFHRKHKGALVAQFGRDNQNALAADQDLIVAGVHLTAGLTDSSVAAKQAQLQTLTDYLVQQHSADAWIIAGDFNIPTSVYTINTALKESFISHQTIATLSSIEAALNDVGLIDAWAVAHVEAADEVVASNYDEVFEGEEGATFDPRYNILAAATSETSNGRPQRYDRVFVRSQGALRVLGFNQFGLPENIDGAQVVASDHSGIRSKLDLSESSAQKGSQSMVVYRRASSELSGSEGLNAALAMRRMFPTEEEERHRQNALAVLNAVITGGPITGESAASDVPFIVVAVGSYALGVWTSGSDIDCLCIGTISSKTFFKLARQRLLKAHDQGVRILRKVEANTGTMLELCVNGVAMDLQYCPAANVVERWSEFRHLATSDPIFNLPILSLRKLKPYRDMLYIQRTLPSMSAFRLAYRCIKHWAVERGLYAPKFGYLGGVHITLMLSWVAKSIALQHGPTTANDLVTSFFHHFAHFDWLNDMMYDTFFHKQKPRYHRSAREPMVILGFHAPNSNIAHTSTQPGLQTLSNELKTADQSLSEPSMTWDKFLGVLDESQSVSSSHGARSFLKTHNNYVKIDIQFWGRTLAKGKGLLGWIESRCVSLVVDVHKALSDLEIRIWPARFTEDDTTERSDYNCCYLIGLSRTHNSTHSSSHDEKLAAKQNLEKVLDRFVTQLRNDEKHYDASTCWVDVSLADSKAVGSLRLDDREWGDYVVEMEPDSEDEEDLDDLSDDDNEPIMRTIPQRHKPTMTPLSSSKLRPASDVLHRLRWDPNLDPNDYIIGYEDRFLGARETGLEKWKTEQTDDEFIPQHRILYFKKKGGDDGKGELVWERVTRIDKVFGSGAGAGAGGA